MLVFRVGKTKYASDLTGEGARLYGGRWNNKMIGCIYTSENRALAVLEYTVNVNIDDIPRSLSITTLEIPDKKIKLLKERELPGDWRNSPSPSTIKDYGSKLLLAASELVIRIPSVIIPAEFNYLINPMHIECKKIKVIDVIDFVFDIRIKSA